jgi:uncharacterized protein
MADRMFILYVADQEAATAFYTAVFDRKPELHVPGMTEFALDGSSSLGLMPEAGIKRLLGDALPDPAAGGGAPRAELYLILDDAADHHARALAAGARELQAMKWMPWGQSVAYSLDLDGHVLAFASSSS